MTSSSYRCSTGSTSGLSSRDVRSGHDINAVAAGDHVIDANEGHGARRSRGMSFDLARPRKLSLVSPRLMKQNSIDHVYNPRDLDGVANGQCLGQGLPKSVSSSSLCLSVYSQPTITPRETITSIRRKKLAHAHCGVPASTKATNGFSGNANINTHAHRGHSHPLSGSTASLSCNGGDTMDSQSRCSCLKEDDSDCENGDVITRTNMADSCHSLDTEGLDDLREQVRLLQAQNTALLEQCEKLVEERNNTKMELEKAQFEREQRENHHREMYLMMYEKGQKSADFVRRDMLEDIAFSDPDSVAVTELLDKLNTTQNQLSSLQMSDRKMAYTEAATLVSRNTTHSEAVLRCIRDALYQHLTDPDRKRRQQHLDLLISLAGFNALQRRVIQKVQARSSILR